MTSPAAHAETIREDANCVMHAVSCSGYGAGITAPGVRDARAALQRLVALAERVATLEEERDEARRDWKQYVHEIEDEQARADGAEERAAKLEAALAEAELLLSSYKTQHCLNHWNRACNCHLCNRTRWVSAQVDDLKEGTWPTGD